MPDTSNMPSSGSNLSSHTTPSVMPIVYPLDEFYAQAGLPLPMIEPIDPGLIPQPQRSLLFHQNDMTPTLQEHHQSPIHLQVIRSEMRGDNYFREVVLRLTPTNIPVEFGAIKIHLHLLPTTARRQILEEQIPLGQIFRECHVSHLSRPKAFLKLTSDEHISRNLNQPVAQVLYGRRNTLTDPQMRPLAEVIEILPSFVPETSKTKSSNP